MTHDEMVNGDNLIADFIGDRPNRPRQNRESFNELPVPLNVIRVVTDSTAESSGSAFTDEAKPRMIHY